MPNNIDKNFVHVSYARGSEFISTYSTTYQGTGTPPTRNGERDKQIAFIPSYGTIVTQGEVITGGLKSDVIVAGGPLANNIAESVDEWPWKLVDGNRVIPANTSLQLLIEKLFLKEVCGEVTLGSITWNPTIGQPTATLDKSGKQEVGTKTTLTIAANVSVSSNTRSCTVTSTQGHFVGTSNTWVKGNHTSSVNGTTSGTATVDIATWNGNAVENGDVVTIAYGTNTLYVHQKDVTASVNALPQETIYASTNTKKKLSSTYVTISDSAPADKSLENETTTKIDGVRYMFAGSNTTQHDTYDSSIVRALKTKCEAATKASTIETNEWSITVVADATEVVIAVPSTLKVTDVYDKRAFGTNIFENFVLTSNVDVNGANNYKAAKYNVYAYKPATKLEPALYHIRVENA